LFQKKEIDFGKLNLKKKSCKESFVNENLKAKNEPKEKQKNIK